MKEQDTGFHGAIADVHFISSADIPNKAAVDLIEMARRSLHYLRNNPMPDHSYQNRFSFAPMECPPFCPSNSGLNGYVDPIFVADTESRNDVAFNMIRQMLGDETSCLPEQEVVHDRLISYIRDSGAFSGLCWTHGHCAGLNGPEKWAGYWCTGLLLQSECQQYEMRMGDLTLARHLFEGVAASAIRRDGRAYFHAGGAFFNEETISEGYRGHYPMIMGPLCDYYLASGDEDCYQLLVEIAEGFICDLTPENLHRSDGGVDGHNHVQLHAVRGMAQFAWISREPRYLEWVKAVYAFYRRWALDTGWLPEIRNLADHSSHSETCLNADMHEVELWLALSGYTEMWDRMDRSIRNYFCPSQFTVTSEFETLYRSVHRNDAPEQVEASLSTLRELEGGFYSALTPNALIFTLREGGTHFGSFSHDDKTLVCDMMGCCPPEGMRAIYYTWKYAVEVRDDDIRINLHIDVDQPAARVVSHLPEKGHVTAVAKLAGNYSMRIPQWAPRGDVTAMRNGMPVPVIWGSTANAYVCFFDVHPGENLEIIYPLIDLWQDAFITPFEQPTQYYRYHWVGNSVVKALPAGKYLPLYEGTVY